MKIVQTKLRSRETTDTYEASFYLMFGAKIESVRKRNLPQSKADKKGYRLEWVISVNNIPDWAYECWKTGYTFGNIQEFVRERKKLKKLIKNATTGN